MVLQVVPCWVVSLVILLVTQLSVLPLVVLLVLVPVPSSVRRWIRLRLRLRL